MTNIRKIFTISCGQQIRHLGSNMNIRGMFAKSFRRTFVIYSHRVAPALRNYTYTHTLSEWNAKCIDP
ncbi:hypothetical protein PGB90_005173 [Kerria lacca]